MDINRVYYSREEIDRAFSEIQTNVANVLVLGASGAGKTSVVDYVFGGAGASHLTKTSGIFLRDGISKNDFQIYDTTFDFENTDFENLVLDFLKNNEIDTIWFCSPTLPRERDVSFIEKIREVGFRICVLITKIDQLSSIKFDSIFEKTREIFGEPIFCVSIFENEKSNWNELFEWTHKTAESVSKERFNFALLDALEQKRTQSRLAIATATSAAALAGACPIPFSDAEILIPIQSALATSILTLYGVELSKGAITGFIGSTSISSLGRSVAGNLAKLIPAVGSTLGAVINASVAATFTGAIGETLNELLYTDAKSVILGKKNALTVEEIFSGEIFSQTLQKIMNKKKKEESTSINLPEKNADSK